MYNHYSATFHKTIETFSITETFVNIFQIIYEPVLVWLSFFKSV